MTSVDFRTRFENHLVELSFRCDDHPDDLGHFRAQVGFLHIERMFTDDEMAAVSAERRVVYTGFDLAIRPDDRVVRRSHDDIRRERAALNYRVADLQRTQGSGSRASSFDL